MKKLMIFTLSCGEMYANSFPESACFCTEGDPTKESFDWREDLRIHASEKGWPLKDSDLESVGSMLDFMIANSPSFSNCIRRTDVKLPGGVVLLDSRAGEEQAPLMLFWEEELLSE